MATNKTVYTLDLDTSRLINNYKAALKEMQKAGVATDVTKGLENQLKKLEEEYNVLANAGKAGFTNTSQITNFNKRVEKLMTSFRGFETNLSGISDKIGQVGKNAQKAGQKLQNAFSKVGFKDAAQQMQAVLSATDREAKLTEIVNEELKKRAQAVAQLRSQYEAAAQAAQEANTKLSESSLSSNATAKINGKSVWTSGKNKPDEATRQAVVAQAQAIAQAASSGQQAWQQFCDYLKNNGLDKIFNKQALPGVEDTIKAMQSNYANFGPLIDQAQQAQQRLNEAQANFNQIGKNNNGVLTLNRGVLSGLTRELNAFNTVEEHAHEIITRNILDSESLAQSQQKVSNAANNVAGSAQLEENSIANLTMDIMDAATESERASKTFDQLKTRITMFFSVTTMFNALRNQIRKTYEDVKQLDKSFASIAMVTKYSVNDMWKSYSQYAEMAGQLGQKTNDVIKASALFYQQGLDTKESLALTVDTMKLATIAGNDYQAATKEMTSALRGFKMEMDEGAHVTDVYSELAAHAAARVDDIAQAMARTASIANSAGMTFENTSAFLTQMIETTQESAENIGTSLKTIIARFTELKENVAGTEDSQFEDLDFNKVDKALKSVGVQLKDTTGQFRNLDEVFLELSQKWDTLDRNTQRYVATIAAGSRQQSRFIAMMDNYERTAELIDYAADAEGKADEQFAKYADTMEYKLNQLKTSWEEFRVQIADSNFFKGVIDNTNKLVQSISNIKLDGVFNKVKFASLIPLAISGAKRFVSAFTSTVSTNLNLAGNIKKSLGKLFLNTRFNIPVDLDPKTAIQVKNKVTNIVKQVESMPGTKVLLKLDTSQLQGGSADINALVAKLKEFGFTEEEAKHAAMEFNQALVAQDMDIKAAAEAMQQYRSVVISSGIAQGFQVIGSAGLTAFSMIATGMKAADVAKFFLVQTSVMAAQYAIQAVLAKAQEKLLTKIKAKGAAERTAIVAGEQAAETGAIIAGGAAQAGAARTSGLAIGGALSEGFIAGTAGIGAIVLAITAAITAVALGIRRLIKKNKERQADAEKELAKLEDKLKDKQQEVSDRRNEAEQAKEQLNSVKELKEEFEELDSKVVKTKEEQERYTELVNEIRETLPNIVESYDTITGKLVVQKQLWDDIVTDYQKLSDDSELKSYFAAVKENFTQTQIDEKKIKVDQNKAEKNRENKKAFEETINVNLNEYGKVFGSRHSKSARDYINEQYIEATNLGEVVDAVDFLEDLLKKLKRIPEAKTYVEDLIKEFNVDTTNANDVDKFLRAIGDKSSGDSVGQYGRLYKDFVSDLYKNISEEDQTKEIEQLIKKNDATNKANLKKYLKATTEYSDEVIEFLANAAIVNKDRITSYNEKDINDYFYEDKKKKSLKSRSQLARTVVDKDTKTTAEDILNYFGIDWQEYEDKRFDSTKTGWQSLIDLGEVRAVINAKFTTDYLEGLDLDDKEQQRIANFYQSLGDLNQNELSLAKDSLEQSFQGRQDVIDNIEQVYEEHQKKIEELVKTLPLDKDFLQTLGYNQLEGLNEVIEQISQKYGDTVTEEYTKKAYSLKEELGLSAEQFSTLLGQDWSKVDLSNVKETKTKLMEALGLSGDEAELVWTKFFNLASSFNFSSMGINNEGALDSLKSQIEESVTSSVDNFSKLSSIIKNQLENGFISFSESNTLKKSLEEVGLKAKDYLSYNANGDLVLSVDKLKKDYQDQVLSQEKLLEIARQETKAKIDQLKIQESIISGVQAQYEGQKYVTEEYIKQAEILKEMGLIKFDRQVYKINPQAEQNLEAYKESIKSQREEYERFYNTELKEGSSYWNNITRWLTAGSREIEAIVREATPTVEDLTKKEKELTDAQKAYADQLEDVAEKQEKLNEALKEYNDLLNGSDNRKSSLDYLYNYDEAINSFNDEISRSKDLMADSKTIQDSAAALTRYAQATHNLIAEETAKQDVIKQGLANYANMIENGSYSYTNRETGATTNINFGNYAKKDSRTGKYIIDQRLLNESKFADKWKDQLEEQVSMYNKYADELLKSEDSVRKAEKEIRDERNAALKKYVSMEQEIADTLKAAYQEEVDQLKNKYDSMKDADDDYIDALQKAIEKQRKLRKQEQGFEDLAKKEKRLSLMSRDTSGANTIEKRKLEEEIQKDRESLLDEAIDNVVDELSKLYESQEKLRDEEMELKEALLDNTLYWNNQAEALAGSFESGEEYAQYLSNLSKEYAEMTLAMQQDKLNEYGQTYTEATEYMAMVAMDTTSETGDFIVDTLIVTGEEVSNIVAETAETFTTEVVRSYNETTAAFVADMQKAEEAIDSANKALQEAYEKLNACAQAANAAAEELNKAKNASAGAGINPYEDNQKYYTGNPADIAQSNYENAQIELAQNKETSKQKDKIQGEAINKLKKSGVANVSELSEYRRKKIAEELKTEGYFVGTVNDTMRVFKNDAELGKWLSANAPSSPVKRYLNGGLADYTGYAYVDGTPEEPEGFLTAEQTQAIGDAAKIFSDIPWLDHSSSNTSVVTNNGGDVNVEINLNIDHISSETDIDEMIQRVKDEIVDVARPEGTNVILQQQLN